ncbi:hypothetical protein B7494_g7310 [Chlorociboria aeruginascens]|nr:hypothetical protein B7494_g7310 [Chlorociboria aeruginascens]
MSHAPNTEAGTDPDDDEEKAAAVAQTPGSTLLPSPVANVVSLVTRSSSLYLRLGTFIGGLALDGARATTLTGLELTRAVIEAILNRAGRDIAIRSTGDLGRLEAEGLLERSIATLHKTITNISFAASTGFYFSAAALSSATDISQQLLAGLDSILGSTDSSRAIASIITLIRREFQNPATGVEGEKVGVVDLLLGICGLALLQRWCRRLTDIENRENKCEEVIWDVVVLNNGKRADVVGNADASSDPKRALTRVNSRDSGSFRTTGDEVLETIERDSKNEESDDDMPEMDLKQRIIQSLPTDASVSITTSTTTTKTITVEITGTQPPDLTPPPGVEIVEENSHHAGNVDLDGEVLTNEQKIELLVPRYRVVYRIIRNKLRGTNIQAGSDETEEAIVNDEAPIPSSTKIPPSPGFIVSPINSPNEREELLKRPAVQVEEIKTDSTASIASTHSQSAGSVGEKPLSPTHGNSGNIANQKISRKPKGSLSSVSSPENPPKKPIVGKHPSAKKQKSEKHTKAQDRKGTFRNALRKGSTTTLSNIWNKDHPESNSAHQSKTTQRPPWGSTAPIVPKSSQLPISQRGSNMVPAREAPRAPQRGNPNYFSSRDLGQMQVQDMPRSPSRASYFSIHERRRDSLVSQTDTYSIHSTEPTRPGSPVAFRTHLRTQGNLIKARSEKNMVSKQPPSPVSYHRRSRSFVPSIYTLKTNNSNTSLVLASDTRRGAFEKTGTLDSLMRTGHVDGMFPQHHLVRNITRFIRFASASYGASFLRVMGITTAAEGVREIDTAHHHEHHSFSNHTQLPADTILLSSFVDPQGGTNSSGETNTGVPMVHFVSLDHDSKAVVLTCRGTLGFEDVLTDMTCDYDDITWRGKDYKVHKGIHASARRLLEGSGGRVLATLKAALEEFPEYGLVMCGHSLGGGVTALLAIMVSEPASTGSAFVTASDYQRAQLLLTSTEGEFSTAPSSLRLPPGRPIHVYAYGPPATISPSLRLATRGLITTVINNQDLVPSLSLGTLHDLQAVALAFKTDDSGAKGEVRNRVWSGLTSSFADKWYSRPEKGSTEEDDQWAYAALKALRACMLSAKLLPPGEVFVVEAMPVLKRNAFMTQEEGLGRPATRSVLKYVRDPEKKFGEVRFGGSMLLDHSPGRYEASLGALRRGVLNE